MVANGTRLGPYEIVAPIGAGGMGEVYKARDTRLDRSVAIKILPGEFAQNAQLKLRFEREAKTISQLSHPHICTLHDVGSDGGVEYLVMELLEGQSLAERLVKGALPIDQVLRYGVEIAEALEKAHRAGVVHRDLKPGNIMLTKTGAKLLDFGLAKPSRPVWSGGVEDLTQQKTLTEEGTIIGTMQYMAPEQLEGREADARTDIFAFGALLYEMITGRRAFDGKSRTSLIAAIVDREPPPISTLQPMAPAALERLVRTCLAKDPEERWQTAHDVVLELRGIVDGMSAAAPQRQRVASRAHWLWLAGSALAVVAAVLTTRALMQPTRVFAPTIRASLLPPPHATFSSIGTLAGGGASLSSVAGGVVGSFAISPDGTAVTFTAVDADGRTLLWLRRLGGFTTTPLRDTENASYPFFSPDGKFIAFYSDGKLRKVAVDGGVPQLICAATRPRGGTWNKDGVIIFTPTSRDALFRVDSRGAVKPLTRLTNGEFTHRWPMFLPDGNHFLYLAETSKNGTTAYAVYASSLDDPEKRTFIVDALSQAFYAEGYLLYCRDRVVFAQKFDAAKLALAGEPVAIADDVQYVQSTAQAIFSVSTNGVLAYQSGAAEATTRLAWLDRSGKEIAAVGDPGSYGAFRLSADGNRIVMSAIDARQGSEDIWVYDLARNVRSRVTYGPTWNSWPVWSADGREIFFRTARTGPVDIYRKSADGSGAERALLHSEPIKFTSDVSPDGKWLAYYSLDPKKATKFDVRVLSLADGRDEAMLETEFNEGEPAFSPDGHWIAYVSDESGRNEIYLTTFPASSRKVQVSTGGGETPRWRRDGKELFFLGTDLMMRAVDVGADGQTSPPKPLFKIRMSGAGALYDVAASGDKFLVGLPPTEAGAATISLVVNWTSELQK
jgi:Tol biopolymer transport system component